MRKIRAGLLSSVSFAFKVTGQRWSDDGALRTITAVDINRGDVSVVNQGANDATTVDARSRRSPGTGNLGLLQARLRAIKIRASAGGDDDDGPAQSSRH